MSQPNGRPRKEIDWVYFEKLCQIHISKKEICNFFNISGATLENKVMEQYGETFSAIWEQKASEGKVSLVRKMFDMAQKGDRTMLIWVSKNLMGWREKSSVEMTANDSKLVINFGEQNDSKNDGGTGGDELPQGEAIEPSPCIEPPDK